MVRTLADNDLHPPVLWLANARAGRDQQMCFAEALDGDRINWDAVLYQLSLYRFRAAHGQTLVVLGRARRVSIPVYFDARVLHMG